MAKPGLIGIENVMRNLNKELVKIKGKSLVGLINAAAFIRRDMDVTPPVIPVGETGNLRASWTAVPFPAPPRVRMRFSAGYAVFVHEMLGEDINWNRPGSGGKFFESALIRNKEEILQTIANTIRF